MGTCVGNVALQVEYRERAAAAGRIPHNFLKREMRMSEKEVLVCRFIGEVETSTHCTHVCACTHTHTHTHACTHIPSIHMLQTLKCTKLEC